MTNDAGVGPPQSDPHDNTLDLSWSTDIAARLAPASSSKRAADFYPIRPHRQPDFLETDEVAAQIVCGGRGMGKSTLLMYRIRHLRGVPNYRMVRAVPPFGFRLVANSIPVPKKAFWQFSSLEPWIAAWKLVLGGLFAFAIKRALDPNLAAHKLDDWLAVFDADPADAMFREFVAGIQRWGHAPHDEAIADLIGTIMNFRTSPDRLGVLYKTKVRPIIAARNSDGGGGDDGRWVLSVDGIDEAITDYDARDSLLSSDAAGKYADGDSVTAQNAPVLAQQIWKCSQAGFSRAAFQLSAETNGQILAFGSIRSEALGEFMNRSGNTASKLEHFVLKIDYPEDLMREVFDYNVRLMPRKVNNSTHTAEPADGPTGAARALCGYEKLYNRTVFSRYEGPYEIVRRHCFGTPRGLVTLGGAIRDIKISDRWDGKPGKWRDPLVVISEVNTRSIEVLHEHLDTLFPPWDKQYEDGFSLLTHNIVTRVEAERIDQQFLADHPRTTRPFFQYLYDCGLVGIPATHSGTEVIQKFLIASASGEPLPNAFEYLMLHPAFSARVRSSLDAGKQQAFYDRRLLVDPGAGCPVSLPAPRIRVVCKLHSTSGSVAVWLCNPDKRLFGDARNVGSVFLVVLAVAIRHFGSGYVDEAQLVFVANKLAELRLIPNAVGKPRQDLDQFFHDVCDNGEHKDSPNQPTAVADAKSTLGGVRSNLRVVPRFQNPGNAYSLAWRDNAQKESTEALLEEYEIEVIGLSTADFMVPRRARPPGGKLPIDVD